MWLDDKNNIVEKKLVKPWALFVLPEKKFNKLVEIPVNKRYRKITRDLGF